MQPSHALGKLKIWEKKAGPGGPAGCSWGPHITPNHCDKWPDLLSEATRLKDLLLPLPAGGWLHPLTSSLSPRPLMPLLDPDSGLLVLAGKVREKLEPPPPTHVHPHQAP